MMDSPLIIKYLEYSKQTPSSLQLLILYSHKYKYIQFPYANERKILEDTLNEVVDKNYINVLNNILKIQNLHSSCLYFLFETAISFCNLQMTKRIIEDGRVDHIGKVENTYIVKETYDCGFPDVVMEVIKGVKVDPLEKGKILSKAVKDGRIDIVEEILKDPTIKLIFKTHCRSPLEKASGSGHLDVVKKLMNDPRIMKLKKKYWYMLDKAIIFASDCGHYQIVKELLKDPRVNPTYDNNSAIRFASEYGYYKIVRELLKDSRVDPSDEHNYAVRFASEYGHYKVVRELLKDPRVDPSVENNFAIITASRNGHYKVVKELLKDPRVDPSYNHNSTILSASIYGHRKVVRELLKDPRVNPSDTNNIAILNALDCGHIDVVKELLKDSRIDQNTKHEYRILVRNYLNENAESIT